jgi:hypothetical protein
MLLCRAESQNRGGIRAENLRFIGPRKIEPIDVARVGVDERIVGSEQQMVRAHAAQRKGQARLRKRRGVVIELLGICARQPGDVLAAIGKQPIILPPYRISLLRTRALRDNLRGIV